MQNDARDIQTECILHKNVDVCPMRIVCVSVDKGRAFRNKTQL